MNNKERIRVLVLLFSNIVPEIAGMLSLGSIASNINNLVNTMNKEYSLA